MPNKWDMALVHKKYDSHRLATTYQRQQTEQALSYFRGEQWIKYENGRLITVSKDTVPLETANKFQIQARTLRAQMLKGRPIGTVKPNGNGNKPLITAQAGNKLTMRLAEYGGYWQTLPKAVLWSVLGGTGIVKVFWMQNDPSLKGIRVRSVSPFDFALDPTATLWDDAEWCIHRIAMSPEKASRLYPDAGEFTADADTSTNNGLLVYTTQRREQVKLSVLIWEYYDFGKGEWCSFANGRQITDIARIVHNPFVVWPFEDDSEFALGSTPMWQASTVQQMINKTFTILMTYMKKIPNVELMVGRDQISMDQEIDSVGGHPVIFWDNQRNPHRPEPLTLSTPPNWIFEFASRILDLADEIPGVSKQMQGQAPFSQITGRALSYLLEQDQIILATADQSFDAAIVKITKLMLQLFQAHGPASVSLSVESDVGKEEYATFAKADLDFGDVTYEQGSIINKSDTVFLETIERLVQSAIIDPQEAKSALIRKGIVADETLFADDIRLARSNIAALVENGDAPPLEPFYAWPVHTEIWTSWAKTEEFDYLDEDIQDIARQYIEALQEKVFAQQQPPEEPKQSPEIGGALATRARLQAVMPDNGQDVQEGEAQRRRIQ